MTNRWIALLILAACAHRAPVGPSWPDPAIQLRDESDRDQVIDAIWAAPVGPARDRIRGPVAEALARRINDALEEDKPFVAADLLEELAGLWQDDPQAIGRGLASAAPLLQTLRATFAKSGALSPSALALVLLAEVEAPRRAAHLADLDELLGFADELAIAENGPHAVRAQPIAILAPVVLALPLPWLVDRYVALLAARQTEIVGLIDREGASMQIVRAHHDILTTARRIAIALARAGRPTEIHARLAGLRGLGVESDRALLARAEVLATNPTAEAYLELASTLRVDDHAPDSAAALAVSLAGLQKYPMHAALLESAANDARSLGRIDQPIVLFETSIRRTGGDVDTTTALRLGKLYAERISRWALGGRPGLARAAWRDTLAFTNASQKTHPDAMWSQAEAIAEASLGRGLLGQGLLAEAEHALEGSIERAPSIEAYEGLATLALQTDDYSATVEWTRAGISILGEATTGDRYRRAKLEQLAADAKRGARRAKDAAASYLDAMRDWASLGETKELPKPIAAERLLATGRAMWWLGDPDKALELVLQAVELDPQSTSIAPSAVAFLLQVNRAAEATDVFHRVLGEPEIGELFKVYMALWLEGDARYHNIAPDRLGHEYLASRHGDVWYEQLAEAATGRLDLAALTAAATTGPRKGELAFYTATLGLVPHADAKRLFTRVIDARLVMDAEYDLARVYLSR